MKHVITFIFGLLLCIPMFSQQTNVSQAQKDSILVQMGKQMEKNSLVGRYKVYPTTNTYNSLRLDTLTGEVYALQISINDDTARMSYRICEGLVEDETRSTVGRYELYPTKNNYNFILLDTIWGSAYQVQWSTKDSECGRWRIW